MPKKKIDNSQKNNKWRLRCDRDKTEIVLLANEQTNSKSVRE